MPYDDAYITEFLTTEGASLDRYVLLDADLCIGRMGSSWWCLSMKTTSSRGRATHS